MGKRDGSSPCATYAEQEMYFYPTSAMMLSFTPLRREYYGPGPIASIDIRLSDPSFAAAAFPAVIDLSTLDGTNGFRIAGIDRYDYSGFSVSSAGDVNGDGFDDIVIGAPYARSGRDRYVGETYVVFGKAGGFAASLDLATLDGSNGFLLRGVDAGDQSGVSVASAGDVNGDGFDDIIVGAYRGDPGGGSDAGESYVVFGKGGGFAADLDLALLDGSNGFRLDGVDAYDRSGRSVSSAGDVNGDGFDDIIIGAAYADPGGDEAAGAGYVVFGKATGFAASFDLALLDGSNGFRLGGIDAGDFAGFSVASAGDINGDGFDDVIIGAASADPGGDSVAGESYVVFGKANGFAASLNLATLNGSNGFRVDGIDAYDASGISVSSAGDMNGDGFDDIIIGADSAGSSGDYNAGESYVVFGKSGGFTASLDLAALDGSNGFRLHGVDPGDRSGGSVSSAGDLNGDGFDDVIIGAAYAGPGGQGAGASYVVFGQATGFAASIDLATLDGSNGFRVDGVEAFDLSGFSVSSAGDVNGDGFDDIMIGAFAAYPEGIAYAGESYVVFGQAPDEAVRRVGSAAGQTIRGGDFNDVLLGKGGADTLAGGAGNDRFTGGKGTDNFVLASSDPADADKIVDFASGKDRVALDSDVFGLAEGRLAAGRFVVGDAAGDANDRLIYNDATGRLFFDADGTGAGTQVLICLLTGAPALVASDIVVI